MGFTLPLDVLREDNVEAKKGKPKTKYGPIQASERVLLLHSRSANKKFQNFTLPLSLALYSLKLRPP